MKPKGTPACCFSFSQMQLPSTTCQVALTFPPSEKGPGEIITSPPKQPQSIRGGGSFSAKQEEREKGKFAQSWLHSAARGKRTAVNFVFLLICFAFTRRGRVRQGQRAHRRWNRPWILSVIVRSQLLPIMALTTSPQFSPADLTGGRQPQQPDGC